MTAYAAVAPTSGGAVVVENSGTTVGTDTVPGGTLLNVRNTGAGTHNLIVGVNAQLDGLGAGTTTPGQRQIQILAAQVLAVRIPALYADANGRVAFGVLEGTFAEVKFTVLGA